MSFRIVSQDLTDAGSLPEAQVFNGMGYHGQNLSPQLSWSGAPPGTKSFVVTLYDPDAPTGSGWWHWIVANIPASVTELARGAGSGRAPLPHGAVQARTDFGTSGYGGAAPPRGESHRYVFSVHALGVERIEVDQHSSGAMVGFMVNMHRLATATLTVHFGGAQ